MAEEAGGDPPLYAPTTNSRKRTRSSSEAAVDDGDRISTLPDAIILHMFSFLDVKDVFKTSILSRRWSSLWTRTSAVSLNFRFPKDFSFLEWFLLLCTSPVIRKFHLHGPNYNLDYTLDLKERIDLVVRFVVGRGVENLCMDLNKYHRGKQYVLPRALMPCKTLTQLKLWGCEFPSLRDGSFMGISWSSLKVLSVHRTKMVDEVINGVLEGSPLLESLTLEACYGMNNIRILSRMMRELVIHGYIDPCFREEEGNGHLKNSCLEISAPYLRSLRLLDRWHGMKVIVLKDVSSLVEVELNFRLAFYKTTVDNIYGNMMGILRKLSSVDRFMVGNWFLMFQDMYQYKLNGDFSLQLKCRHLTITTAAHQYYLGRIARVLELAPNVEKLVIRFSPRKCLEVIPTKDYPPLRRNSWASLTGHVKNIEITGFPARIETEPTYWSSLIKVLLGDAHVLEKMVINVKWSWRHPDVCIEEAHVQDVLEVAEDILGCQRGSKSAKVILNYPFKRRHSQAGLF